MKTVKALLFISIIACLLASVSFAADEPATGGQPAARPAGPGGPGGMGGGGARMGGGMGMGGMNPARMVIMMREQLKLTDEQVTKIEAIKPADPNAPQKAQREMAETQQALRTAVVAGDEAKIKELSKQLGQITEKTSLLQAQEYKQIKQILTADQYKELQQMMTRPMAGRMGGAGGGMGGAQGGRMGGGMGGGMGGQGPGPSGPGAPGGNPPPVRPNNGGQN